MDVRFVTVADGLHLQVDAFHAAEGLIDLPQAFVRAHSVFDAQRGWLFAGAYDVEAIHIEHDSERSSE